MLVVTKAGHCTYESGRKESFDCEREWTVLIFRHLSFCVQYASKQNDLWVTHQSIPAVPIPPTRALVGHLLTF